MVKRSKSRKKRLIGQRDIPSLSTAGSGSTGIASSHPRSNRRERAGSEDTRGLEGTSDGLTEHGEVCFVMKRNRATEGEWMGTGRRGGRRNVCGWCRVPDLLPCNSGSG